MSDLFISHVAADSDVALELALGLEQAGYSTWCFELDSLPAVSYLIQTGKAIEACKAIVLVISPRSLDSRQVTREVVRAHESGKAFVPVLHDMGHGEKGRLEGFEPRAEPGALHRHRGACKDGSLPMPCECVRAGSRAR